jgi:hypothetical protein
MDTAREYSWNINPLPKGMRFYDLILTKGLTRLSFRFDKRERISAAGHTRDGEYIRYPGQRKLDYAIEVLRGPLRPPIELRLKEKLMADNDLTNMNDDEINRRKFVLMQRLCDDKGLPYPPQLVAYLARKEN